MNRTLSTLFAGLLIAALSPVALGALPASSAAIATAGTVRPPVPPADLAALLSNGLALRVAVDNNHAAAAGVPCADLGADGAACATGRLILQNRGHQAIADGGWKLYLHSIRRLLRIDRPGFALRRLTGDLYELTPQPGSVRLAPGERVELPFVAEYWLLRYSDVIPRPYVVVDGAPPAVLRYNDTDDELRYVESLPADAQNNSTGNAPPVAARPDASRALPSVKREQPLPGTLDLRGVELTLPNLPDAQVAALRERASTLGSTAHACRYGGGRAAPTAGRHRDAGRLPARDRAARCVHRSVRSRRPLLRRADALLARTRWRRPDPGDARRGCTALHASRDARRSRAQLQASGDAAPPDRPDERVQAQSPAPASVRRRGLAHRDSRPARTHRDRGRRCHDPSETRCLLPQLGSDRTTAPAAAT